MRLGRAAFLFDPGWLFVLAGLVLVASAALVPATYDLWVMRTQLRHLDAQERENGLRLDAYSKFVAALDAADPQLVRRLAASQLNLVPRGERPVIVAATAGQTPIEWADAAVPDVRATVDPFPDSLLSRLTLGRKALWIAGAGAMCIFLGLLSSPIRLRLSAAPIAEAGESAVRALGIAPTPMLAGIGMGAGAMLAAAPDTQPSARPVVRLGGDHPHEGDPSPSGAD